MSERDPIDFASLAAALLDRAETLVSQWLDDGHREGHEWKARNPIRDDRHIGSFSVNLVTGNWADFADDDAKGGDLISLYAYLNRLNNGQAARQLMRTLGWASRDDDDVQTPARNPPAPKAASEESVSPQRKKKQSKWRALVPVPPHAPRPSFVFGYRDERRGDWIELDAVKTWAYQFEGQLFGYVARFERTTSDGEISKETIPRTWCVDESDDRGLQRWHWKTWEAPRPLYVPATLLSGTPADVPVVLVEGEKCAMSGHELLGHEFDFVSWPGGGKAWAKASWNWLMGRTIFMWPDCDAKRVLLTRAEREAGVDPSTKPLLPEAKQPGVKAMISIGSLLVAEYGCTVYLCQIPKPGAVSDGWDIADAIAQGWDADQVRGFIRRAHVFTPPDDAARARARATEGISTPSLAGADQEEPDRNWRSALLTSAQGATKAVRENIVVALDGLPEKGINGIPEALGVVGFNEFTNDVVLLKQAPWGSPDGPCAEVEDMLMGEWLVREHWLPSMPRGTLEEGLRIVAHKHRFHPVRQRLMGLEWDGTSRLGTWLRRACLEEDEWNDEDDLQRYLRLAGTFFLMGMVARVLEPVKVVGSVIRGPGTKFDYMLILEGRTGLRKSTLLQTLAGEHFADTGLVLGDKDSYQQLQGVWLYEIPELDAFSKADVMKIKAYVASQTDYFRASFDRRARKYPRQVVFGGTTNEDHYLSDPTGNRRFWPVRVTRLIDIDWVLANRDQLFAEAVHRVMAGERMYPTPQEERALFEPQQQLRMVENAIETKIMEYLYPEGNPSGANSDGSMITRISIPALLGKIGIGVEKLGPGRFHERQAGAALRRLGWSEGARPGKAGTARPRVWERPAHEPYGAVASPGGSSASRPTQGVHTTTEVTDDCPF